MAVPLVAPSAHVDDLARVAATDALLAVGLAVTLGLCGQFSVGHAALYAVGAYATGLLTAEHGWSSWPALGAAVAAAAVAGALVGLPALRVRGDQLAVITLFAGLVVQQVLLAATSVTGGYGGVTDIPAPSLLGHELVSRQDSYLLAAGALLVSVVALEWLRRSPLGLAMLAVREDEVAARSSGVPVGLTKVTAFAVGGAVAGLAGFCYAGAIVSISPPTFDLTLSVLLVLMVLVGGPGRIYGVVAGAGALATLIELLRPYSSVEEGLTGGAIVAVVLWRARLRHVVAGRVRRLAVRRRGLPA